MSTIKVGDKVRVVKADGIHNFKPGTEGVVEVVEESDNMADVLATCGDIVPEIQCHIEDASSEPIAQWCTIDSLEVIE